MPSHLIHIVAVILSTGLVSFIVAFIACAWISEQEEVEGAGVASFFISLFVAFTAMVICTAILIK